MMMFYDGPHSGRFAPFDLDRIVDLPPCVWCLCLDLIEALDGLDWTELPIRSRAVWDALEAATGYPVTEASLVMLDDCSCSLYVEMEIPETMENYIVFGLGIEADLPEAWVPIMIRAGDHSPALFYD